MQTVGKRVLSSLMSVVLVAGLCPAPAFAGGEGSTSGGDAAGGSLVALSSDLRVSGNEAGTDLEKAEVDGVTDLAASKDGTYVYDAFPDLVVALGGEVLKSRTDYYLQVKKSADSEVTNDYVSSIPNEPGRYYLAISAASGSGYTGEMLVEFDVIAGKVPLSDAQIELDNDKLLATGEPVEPVYWVYKYGDSGRKVALVEGEDYTIAIVKNKWDASNGPVAVEPGKYYVRFESCPNGDYVGTEFRAFWVYAANDLTRAVVTVGEVDDVWYESTEETRNHFELPSAVTVLLDSKVVDSSNYDVKFYKTYSYRYESDSDDYYGNYAFDDEDLLTYLPDRGQYYVTVTGKKNSEGVEYIGGTFGNFDVLDRKCLSDGSLYLGQYSYSLSKGVSPTPTVTVKDRTLQQGRDYEITYYHTVDGEKQAVTSFAEPGSYWAEATPVEGSGYYGSCTRGFTILNPLSLNDLYCDENATKFLASGEPVAFKVTIWAEGYYGSISDEDDGDDEGKLVEGTDYEVVFTDKDGNEIQRPSEPGVYEAIARGLDKYAGSQVKWEITIYAKGDINSALTSYYRYVDEIYTGERDVPGISLRRLGVDGRRGDMLCLGVDFVIDHYETFDGQVVQGDLKDVGPGTYYMVVKGIGEYEGSSLREPFVVYDSKDLSNAAVTGFYGHWMNSAGGSWSSSWDFAYTGFPVVPVRSVVLNGIPLLRGADYEILYYREGQLVDEAVEPGSYTIRLVPGTNKAYVNNGIGSYFYQGGFTITSTENNLDNALVKVATDCYYGEPVAAKPTVLLGGKELEEGKDYTVTYMNDDGILLDGTRLSSDGKDSSYRAQIKPVEGSGLIGSAEKRFSLKDATAMSEASVSFDGSRSLLLSRVKAGTAPRIEVVSYDGDGRELVENKDYVLEFAKEPASEDYEQSDLDYSTTRPDSIGNWYVRARGVEPFEGVSEYFSFTVSDVQDIASYEFDPYGWLYNYSDGTRRLSLSFDNGRLALTGLSQDDGAWPYGSGYVYSRTLREGQDITVDKTGESYRVYDANHVPVDESSIVPGVTYYMHVLPKAGSGLSGEKWAGFQVWSYDLTADDEAYSAASVAAFDDDGAEGDGEKSLSVAIDKYRYAYSGDGIDPGIVVTYDGETLERGGEAANYTLTFYEWSNYYDRSKTNPLPGLPARIGEYVAFVSATIGGNTLTSEQSFQIVNPYDFGNATLEGIDRYYYYGYDEVSSIKPVVKRADGVELNEGEDYELRLSYYDPDYGAWVDADDFASYGRYMYEAYGKGSYVGEGPSDTFCYWSDSDGAGLSISDATIDLSNVSRFTGTWFSVHPKVTLNGVELTENKDYCIYLYGGNDYYYGANVVTRTGEYELEICGMGKYDGYRYETLTVHDPSYADTTPTVSLEKSATVTGIPASIAYAGTSVTPTPVVKVGNTTLRAGTDYTVSYSKNTAPGTASVTITAKGGTYTGSVTRNFTITKGSLSTAVISNVVGKAYDGTAHTQSPVVKLANGVTLAAGTDYTVSYKNNKNAGTAVVTVTGTGKYQDSKSANFTISAKSLAKAKVSGLKTVTYDGKQKKASLTVKVGKVKLASGTDYTVKYKSNVNAGKASVVIQGKGNYSGKLTKTFTIEKAKLGKATISVKSQKYKKGKACKPKPTVKLGKTSLKLNRDYTVSYKNNKKKGKATLTIKGKGNYTGSASKKFTIK